jgi:hypothetical protein
MHNSLLDEALDSLWILKEEGSGTENTVAVKPAPNAMPPQKNGNPTLCHFLASQK